MHEVAAHTHVCVHTHTHTQLDDEYYSVLNILKYDIPCHAINLTGADVEVVRDDTKLQTDAVNSSTL